VGEGPKRTIHVTFKGVRGFSHKQSCIRHMCALLALLAYARVHASFSVSTHVNFLTSCIVFSFWKCIFGVVGELIGVWRCCIPVTICEQNFSDNSKSEVARRVDGESFTIVEIMKKPLVF
jgi:hypothetical protein